MDFTQEQLQQLYQQAKKYNVPELLWYVKYDIEKAKKLIIEGADPNQKHKITVPSTLFWDMFMEGDARSRERWLRRRGEMYTIEISFIIMLSNEDRKQIDTLMKRLSMDPAVIELFEAVSSGDIERVRALVATHGANHVDEYDVTLLIRSANFPDISELLIDAGADTKANEEGFFAVTVDFPRFAHLFQCYYTYTTPKVIDRCIQDQAWFDALMVVAHPAIYNTICHRAVARGSVYAAVEMVKRGHTLMAYNKTDHGLIRSVLECNINGIAYSYHDMIEDDAIAYFKSLLTQG